MDMNKYSFAVNEEPEYYIIYGGFKTIDDLKITLDKPLFIDGNLMVKGKIESNTSIQCKGAIECTEINSSSMIKCESIDADLVECPTLECLEEAYIRNFIGNSMTCLGSCFILKSIICKTLFSGYRLETRDIVADSVNVSKFLLISGIPAIKSIVYKDASFNFKKTTIQNNKIETTIFNDNQTINFSLSNENGQSIENVSSSSGSN
jgi:hypothetical protein